MDYFTTIYNNVDSVLTFDVNYQLGTYNDKHKWKSLSEMSAEMLGLEPGQVGKIEDNVGRKALVLSSVVGLVVIYQHLKGRMMLGLTCNNKHLKDILCVKHGVREDTLMLLFGRNDGLDNSHRLNDLLMNLTTDIKSKNNNQIDLI